MSRLDRLLSVEGSEKELEVRCPNCDTLLATSRGSVMRIHGVPVMALGAVCPKCGEEVPLTGGLRISPKAASRITRALNAIRENEGFGVLMIRFERGRARYAGLGECMENVSD